MELFEKIVNGWKPSAIFEEIPILDVWLNYEFTTGLATCIVFVVMGEKQVYDCFSEQKFC